MGTLVINNTKVSTEDINISPFIDDTNNMVYESITVIASNLIDNLKVNSPYKIEVSGQNQESNKAETYTLPNFKLHSVDKKAKTYFFVNADFHFNYELEMKLKSAK